MRKLALLVPASAALLALGLVPARGASSPKIEWVDPSPSPPEASAPLPPKETPPSAAPETSAQAKPAEGTAAPVPSPQPPAEQQQGSSRPPVKPVAPHPRRSATPVRLPAPETPLKPAAPEISPLTTEAANFMNAYWANAGGSSDQVLPYLSSIYAPVVDYYGNPVSRESILKEKLNFIRRWPIRQTWLPPGEASPRISCDNATAECEITGVRDFDAVSAERGARSVGAVRYSYTVRFAEGSPQIVAEDSKIVSHE
ncbi:MAG: hypothetical protein WBX30_17645 [Stellaceae bacterium]